MNSESLRFNRQANLSELDNTDILFASPSEAVFAKKPDFKGALRRRFHTQARWQFISAKTELFLKGRHLGISTIDVAWLAENISSEKIYPSQEVDCYRLAYQKVQQAFANLSTEAQMALRQPIRIQNHLAKKLRHLNIIEQQGLAAFQRLSQTEVNQALPGELFSILPADLLESYTAGDDRFEQLRRDLMDFLQIGLFTTKKPRRLYEAREWGIYCQITESARNFKYSYIQALENGDERMRQALFAFGDSTWQDINGQSFGDINQLLQFHLPIDGFYVSTAYPMAERPYDLKLEGVYSNNHID